MNFCLVTLLYEGHCSFNFASSGAQVRRYAPPRGEPRVLMRYDEAIWRICFCVPNQVSTIQVMGWGIGKRNEERELLISITGWRRWLWRCCPCKF